MGWYPKRNNFRDIHHLYPKVRRIKHTDEYVIRLWRGKHCAWHFIFGARTIKEVIELLQRIERRYCR